MSKRPPYPFLKWLGGKARMAGRVMSRLPQKIDTYGEPMLGGGAVFIELARERRFRRAVLADLNPDLVNTWLVVRDDVDSLVKELRLPRYEYRKEVFLEHRGAEVASLSHVEAAARFIYLNRTCFNGVYRVNREGRFNVPFGSYVNPLICDEPNLRAVSELLEGVEVRCCDFKQFLDDFPTRTVPQKSEHVNAVYADPPYIPVSETANFTSYTEAGFGIDEQAELARGLWRHAANGVRVVASNSAAKAALALYEKFDVDEVRGSRSVGGDGSKRKTVKEIIAFAGPRS
jgi:DNA adenine methylase